MRLDRKFLKLYDEAIINWSLYFELPDEDISIKINEDGSYNLSLKFDYLRLLHIKKMAFKVSTEPIVALGIWDGNKYSLEVGCFDLDYRVPKRSEG